MNISKIKISPKRSILLFMAAIVALCGLVQGQGTTTGGMGGDGGTMNFYGSGPVTVSSIAVTPASQSQNVGVTVGFTATATLSSGGTVDITANAAWSTSNSGIAAIVNLIAGPPALEDIKCISAGTVQVIASYGGTASGSTPFTCVGVLPPVPTAISLILAPLSPSISAGQAVQFTATQTYSDGSTQDVTASSLFTSGTPSIATIGPLTSTREVDCTSSGGGTSVITAVNGILTPAFTTLTCNAVLNTITIAPASPSIVAGTTLQFAATCNYSDGSSKPCVAPTWSSNSTTTATISSAGLASGLAAASATIKAQIGSVSGTTTLTVTAPVTPPATLSSILVSPASKTINVGASLPFIATGTYSDGSTANVSAQAVWTTSNAAVASLQLPDAVAGTTYSQTLTGTGAAPYIWTVPSLASSGQIDILDYAAPSTRNTSHLAVTGLYKAFHIDGGLLWWIKNSAGNPWDGELYDGSFFYHWFTEDGDSADQAACIAAGFSSCFLDPSASKMFVTPVKVAPRYFTLGGSDVVVKSPSPNNFVRTTNCGVDKQPLINLGNIMGITHDSGNVNWGGSVGTVRTIEIQYYWGIANETTVPPQSGTRERYELALGFGQVVWDTSHWNGSGWTVDQTSTDNVVVAGGAPTPNFACKLPALPLSGALPPGIISTARPQLNLGDTTGVISGTPNTPGTYPVTVQQEDAGGTFHMQSQTIRVNATAGTAQQTVNGLTAGSATITATIGAISNGTTLTVQTPVPTLSSIAVTPANPTQYNGSTVQFTATGTYSDASTQNLTSQVAWTSGTPAVATIGAATGLATCVANSGSSTITATLSAVSGTTSLTCQTATTNTGGNAYCTTAGTWIGPTVDGPAALPVQCMHTALSNTPSPGTVRGPVAASALAATYTAAACGDVILVTAGTTVNGPVTLTGKHCDSAHWITIKSTGVSSGTFPAEGVRATPCISNITSMPGRLAYPCASPSLLTAQFVATPNNNAIVLNGADHLRFIGLEFTRASTAAAIFYSLIDLTSNTGTQTNNIIFDRDWIHGIEATFPQTKATDTSITRAFYLAQSNHAAIIDSTISNIYDNGAVATNGNTDSQCVGGGFGSVQASGWGVYKFVNNHAECGSEGILLGGSSGPKNSPLGCVFGSTCTLDVPTDIEIRQNHFFAPNSWNCNTSTINTTGCPNRKNGVELKTGARVLIEGNVFENCWYSSQPYCGVVAYAPKNQMNSATDPGTCPTCLVQDAVARFNYGYNYPGIQFSLYTTSFVGGCAGCGQTLGRRLVFHDNLMGDKLNVGSVTGVTGYDCITFAATAGPMTDIAITHNTCVNAVRSMMLFGANAAGLMDRVTIQNNLMTAGTYGVIPFTAGGCDKSGASFFTMLNACVNGTSVTWTADHNGIFSWSTANLGGTLGKGWPTNNNGAGNTFYANTTGPMFTSYNTDSGFTPGNFQLLTASPLHNAGSDGKDLGADIVTLTQKIAGVRQ